MIVNPRGVVLDTVEVPIKPSRIHPRDTKPDREVRVKHRIPKSEPYKRDRRVPPVSQDGDDHD